MTMLTVKGLAKSFPTAEGAVRAVHGVTFCIAQAQCYALLGPSGCGKTTILRCVAGLERAEEGSIAIGGRVVSDGDSFVPVHERAIGMVFQSYAIWPHLDVFDNVAYPLEVERPRVARAEIEKRVNDVLALVGLCCFAPGPLQVQAHVESVPAAVGVHLVVPGVTQEASRVADDPREKRCSNKHGAGPHENENARQLARRRRHRRPASCLAHGGSLQPLRR